MRLKLNLSPQKASPVANNHHEENFNSFPRNINNNSIFPTNFQGNADHKKPLSLNLATLSPNHSMNSFTIKNCPDCEQNRQKQIVMERELAETRGSNYEHIYCVSTIYKNTEFWTFLFQN